MCRAYINMICPHLPSLSLQVAHSQVLARPISLLRNSQVISKEPTFMTSLQQSTQLSTVRSSIRVCDEDVYIATCWLASAIGTTCDHLRIQATVNCCCKLPHLGREFVSILCA